MPITIYDNVIETWESRGFKFKFKKRQKKNIKWLFSSVLVLMDRVTWYQLLVGDDKYPVKLVEMHEKWFEYNNHRNKKNIKSQLYHNTSGWIHKRHES